MLRNSSASNEAAAPSGAGARRLFAAAALAAAFCLGAWAQGPAAAPDSARWFESDGAGIAYRSIPEAAAARSEWSLRIRPLSERIEGVEASSVEEKTLYEQGVERRRTVTAVDSAGAVRYADTVEADGSRRTERYDALRRLVEERSTGSDGAGETIRYSWAGDRLVSASAFPVAADGTVGSEALWTDAYRYLRSGALLSVTRDGESSVFTQRTERAVPRILETRSSDGSSMRTVYDASGRISEVLRYGPDGASVPASETVVYGEGGKRAGPSMTSRKEGDERVETERNEAGRVVRETRYGPDGAVQEEILTEWSGDRMKTVRIVSGTQERRTEYGYDAKGRRVSEKNYRNGRLERSVRIDGSSEVEELYRNGAVALRSYYEGGTLVREERIR